METVVSAIRGAIGGLCLAYVAIFTFWLAIIIEKDFSDIKAVTVLGVVLLVGGAVLPVSINQRYKYEASKVVFVMSGIVLINALFYVVETYSKLTFIITELALGILFLLAFMVTKKLLEGMKNQAQEQEEIRCRQRRQQGGNYRMKAETHITAAKQQTAALADDGLVICPACGRRQKVDRKSCFDCGAVFDKNEK